MFYWHAFECIICDIAAILAHGRDGLTYVCGKNAVNIDQVINDLSGITLILSKPMLTSRQ